MPELADIFRLHGPRYLVTYREKILPSHRRAIQDISSCRTEAFGGHLYRCPACRQDHYRYHSCKNRHCPKCQNDQVDRWIDRQQHALLPVTYFMATFTLPAGLRRLARHKQRLIYHFLFQASQYALQKLAADPARLGGSLGMVGVLHTWTRDLRYHPHIHYLIPGGALSRKQSWHPADPDFLLPEKPLALIFRGKLRDLLKKAGLLDHVPSHIWRQGWVVDVIPVGSGELAVKYLAAYVFRVAISNRNIIAFDESSVTFRYRDSKTREFRITTLPAERFMARFLQHILPRGFQKVRTYGFLHPKQRHILAIVKEQLQADGKPVRLHPSPQSIHQKPVQVLCPHCGAPMIPVAHLHRKRGPP